MNTNHLLVAFRNRALGVKETTSNWTHEIEYLYKRGVGIDEALHYLYFEKPSIEEFKQWVNEKETKLVPSVAEVGNVLNDEELTFFKPMGILFCQMRFQKRIVLRPNK